MWIEMSRETEHGGIGWEFATCVWSPVAKENKSSWPFWTAVGNAKKGEEVLHLTGKGTGAHFVGYSQVASDGYHTKETPPAPGPWKWSKDFFRADLRDFVPFENPISLTAIFSTRRSELEEYFSANRIGNKRHVFFVKQSGRLQCLNGAYLSEVDAELLAALFGDQISAVNRNSPLSFARTGTQLRELLTRQGQRAFSDNVRDSFDGRCCFPDCEVSDRRFLVGAHIARWTDNAELRGQTGNGLCLCLEHDRAFEIGLFWLEDDLSVTVNVSSALPLGEIGRRLLAAQGQKIRPGRIPPIRDALREHRSRFVRG